MIGKTNIWRNLCERVFENVMKKIIFECISMIPNFCDQSAIRVISHRRSIQVYFCQIS